MVGLGRLVLVLKQLGNGVRGFQFQERGTKYKNLIATAYLRVVR